MVACKLQSTYRRVPGLSGHGEGVDDCIGTPSELQFDSCGVRSSVFSKEVLCVLLKVCSTGISARPNRKIRIL